MSCCAHFDYHPRLLMQLMLINAYLRYHELQVSGTTSMLQMKSPSRPSHPSPALSPNKIVSICAGRVSTFFIACLNPCSWFAPEARDLARANMLQRYMRRGCRLGLAGLQFGEMLAEPCCDLVTFCLFMPHTDLRHLSRDSQFSMG